MNNLNKSVDVVLLCGGKGQRLRPHTLRTPKPLLVVNKKPFLFFLIKNFLKINVNQIILATGYKAEKVENFVNKYFKNNKKIKMINSGNVDIIKRLKDSSELIKKDFFVCYGDTYVDIDLKKYIKKFYSSKKSCSVVSSFYKLKYGTIEYNKISKVVKKFKEKPIIDDTINLGYFVFKKDLIKEIKKNKSWINFLTKISKKKEMVTHITNKKFFSFDSPREYFEIKSRFIK